MQEYDLIGLETESTGRQRILSSCPLPFDIDETISYVMALPDKYKAAIYLHYYEGYSAAEIGKLINKSEASVWGYLHKGRKLLKVRLTEV